MPLFSGSRLPQNVFAFPTRRLTLSALAGGFCAVANPIWGFSAWSQVFSTQARRLYDDVLIYFRYGPHRTGGPGDVATARWLVSELDQAGVKAELQPWKLTQFFLQERRLVVGEEAIEVFPLWLPKPTPASGVSAELALMETASDEALKGKIAIFEADLPVVNKKSNQPGMIERAAKAGALAAICSNGGYVNSETEDGQERRQRLTQNSFAPFNQIQWPIPAASVAYKDFDKLQSAARNRKKAHLTITGGKLIVISTPLSGWIDSAGERGGGIALWLDLARWAAGKERKASYLFNATSGHEIGYIGQDHFIEKYGPKPDAVRAWVHLGSGLGSYDWQETSEGIVRRHDSYGVALVGASESLQTFVTEAFGHLPKEKFIPAGKAQGELRGAHDAGYATFGLYGGNMFSHSAFDGPQQVSPLLLEQLSEGLKKALMKLEEMA
jgi:hypothetical protein